VKDDFGKKYRLHRKDEIDVLFQEGKKIHCFPFLSHVYEKLGETPHFSVLISVPKKKIRKSHDRNRIKRMVRECLRRNKEPLVKKSREAGYVLHVSIVYLSNEIAEYPKVESQIKQIIQKICA
jgi:ribonuclease P protein component